MEAESGQSATTRATWLLLSSDEEEGGGEEEVRLVSATLFPVDWRHRVRRNLAALEEYCLCVIIPALLCMFAASALTADWYSTQILTLSPNTSLLIEPSPWLVYAIKIQVFHGQAGPMLYGFISAPPLRSKATWDEVHDIIVGPHHVEASTMWLNKGSFLNVTCSIKRPGAANVVVKILEEQKSAQSWIQDFNQESELQCFQTNFNHPVAGGQLHYVVPRDGNYSVLVDNLEKQTVEVLLVLQIYATLYSTDAAVYLCIPYPKACSLHLSMFGKRAALLSTPNEYQNSSWEATLSYRIRWFSIATALGCSFLVASATFKIARRLQFQISHDRREWESRHEETADWEDDDEINDIEESSDCSLCMNAHKNSFFIPCGHFETCLSCGIKLKDEEGGMCPICNRAIDVVKEIVHA